jgi:hypothetical protein
MGKIGVSEAMSRYVSVATRRDVCSGIPWDSLTTHFAVATALRLRSDGFRRLSSIAYTLQFAKALAATSADCYESL